MEYYSAIKRNAFELVLMRWMKLVCLIQREVNQKEKDKCHILTHSTDDPTNRAAKETQTKRTDFWTQWGKERVG